MTAQEIFTKVATHLLKQNRRSFSVGKGCLYRGPEQTMCAVGCLIPDELYNPEMEGAGVSLSVVEESRASRALHEALGAAGLGGHLSLLIKLQRVHDTWAPGVWHYELKELAKLENLEMP